MRIGLNATVFNDRPSGAKQRFVGIYGALIRQKPDWTFVLYEPVDCRVADWFSGAPNVIARRTPIASSGRLQRIIKGAGYWRKRFREDALDLFEDFVLPMVKHPAAPTILTIHDLRPLAKTGSLPLRIAASAIMHRSFAKADRVVAVSHAVRDDILAFHPTALVSTVYNGVDPDDFVLPGAGTIADVRARYALPDRYILAIGHLEARKNLGLLVDAIGVLRDAGTPYPLVIVGNEGGAGQEIRARIATLQLDGLVTLVQHADDADVRAFYADCDLLAFPSRYEGFGIPILEAMAAGKPMVLADTPVFRELTLDQGLYFPVHDARAAAAAIATVWRNPAECERQRAFGAWRVRDFGFDALAVQVAELYETLT